MNRWAYARDLLDDIVGALRHSRMWDVRPPDDAALVAPGAFGTETMSLEQWLRYVLVPRLEGIIDEHGTFPSSSEVARHATREWVHFGVVPHAGPVISALARLDAFVAMLGMRATELGFFEGPRAMTEPGELARELAVERTRFVYWLLELTHPAPGVPSSLELEARWTDPEGNELARQTVTHEIEGAWTRSYRLHSFGWDEPGRWSLGAYEVELRCWNEPLASGAFRVV